MKGNQCVNEYVVLIILNANRHLNRSKFHNTTRKVRQRKFPLFSSKSLSVVRKKTFIFQKRIQR
jgi:hypothetical protein